MNFEVSLGCEPVSADVALVRPFPCVRPDVNLQGRVRAKDLAAVATPVLEKGGVRENLSKGDGQRAITIHAPSFAGHLKIKFKQLETQQIKLLL